MDDQLTAIAEVVDLAEWLDVPVWLRGGWAVDFFLGRVTRPHLDVDWFAHTEHADRLVAALLDLGYAHLDKVPRDQQVDLVRGDVEHGIALLGRDPAGAPVVPAGPYAGEPWPLDLLDWPPVELHGIRCRVVHPRAQVEIKRMMPEWVPGTRRRAKDAADISLLTAALDA
ncbi:hypothetical protein [Actinokineospora sp. NBRC 105648]|uniref:nucleotidyltransferase domain-containing protein n=1 Tax=Actinokineospora sp. NBRC 105648 TaxID=3032206 RepID=UPI0024A45919|nr:hypothetical protein [Actinokineospora sp. NBRC 105648]GLZ39614.1 hypothetical protein Acsp05_32380 [Actinokineospora sp. NBRC 105648]